jgi:hypothetical protein
MRGLVRKLLWFLLVVISLPAAAHDVGVMKLRFEELADSRYQLRYVAPPGSPESLAPPVLPERAAWEEEPGMPEGLMLLTFTTEDGGRLLDEECLTLPWQRDGVLVESFWRSGETSRRYFPASRDGIVIRIGDLRAGTGNLGEAAKRYTLLGSEHILSGWDHLLFICCLLMLVRGWKRIILTITAFTAAHSLMLGLATFGWSPLNPMLVEAMIALSIAFLAAEVLRERKATFLERPMIAAFGFGLLHGMGLAGALRDLDLPRAELPAALGFFNLGVELGQLAFVVPVLAAAWVWRRLRIGNGERFIPAAASVAGVIAMFWFVSRTLTMFG